MSTLKFSPEITLLTSEPRPPDPKCIKTDVRCALCNEVPQQDEKDVTYVARM